MRSRCLHLLLSLFLGIGFGEAALAHARLVRTEPASGATLASAPTTLTLHFNSLIEQRFARFTLVTPTARHALSAASQPGRTVKVIRVPLPKLPSGHYRVDWSVVSRDSHRVEGSVTFTVR